MEFRKVVTIILYTRQQKRHWWIEQSCGLCGRGRGWDDLGEWHLNMNNNHIWNESPVKVRWTILDAWGWCTRTTQGDGTGREEGGGFRMGNTCIPVAIHVDIWQNQYNIVKLKNKIKIKILVTNCDNIIGNNFQIVTYGTINHFGNWRNLLKKNILE